MKNLPRANRASRLSHTVFDLRKISVVTDWRERLFRHDVDLITQKYEGRAQLAFQLALNSRNVLDGVTRDFGGEGFQLREILSMIRETDWHNRQRTHSRVQTGHIGYGALEVGAIVPVRAQNDLTMD